MLLNSSSIDEYGALKLVELGNTLAQKVSMLILQVATTRHRHTELLNGILITNTYQAQVKRGKGGLGKK